MDGKLIRYLQALNLTPIWLKNDASSSTPPLTQQNDSKVSSSNTYRLSAPQTYTKNTLTTTEPTNGSSTSTQPSDLNVLQINSRLQLLLFKVEKKGKTLQQGDYLFATLAPHFAEQSDHPLTHPQYGRMLEKLLLAVGAETSSIQKLNVIPDSPLAGALLFSRHFAGSPLDQTLAVKGIARLILDHPLVLSHCQFRKKETWDQLKRFNPSI